MAGSRTVYLRVDTVVELKRFCDRYMIELPRSELVNRLIIKAIRRIDEVCRERCSGVIHDLGSWLKCIHRCAMYELR